MGEKIIEVRGLGKQYLIGERRPKYRTLRDSIGDFLRHIQFRQWGSNQQHIWALKDVSFSVERGEALGVIGRNGAGKSTLLQILSRITEPTEGSAVLRGRVGSLLEVGTGFHHELTGMENIYLNGAILGMRKSEIDGKLDEIIRFSEIEKFIDTPMKFYSSGMYVRLAFAVAAHLEPDIILVDEVLAVGDAQFSKKCIGKMGDVTSEGRTILFVSHNMAAIRNLCSRAILLDEGRVKSSGDVGSVIDEYDKEVASTQKNRSHFPITNTNYGLSLDDFNVEVIQDDGHAHLRIELKLKSSGRIGRLGVGVMVNTLDGFPVAKLWPSVTNNVIEGVHGDCLCILEARNIEQFLASGEYNVGVVITKSRETIINSENLARLNVPVFDVYGSGIPFRNSTHGVVPLPLKLIEVRER